MRTLGDLMGISRQNEVLMLTLLGICCTIFDASAFNLHSNLQKVWNVKMDPSKFTFTMQLYLKYVISSIVIVRTFTVHMYLAFYIVMLWPAIFQERAGLLVPWLLTGFLKSLLTSVMAFSAGVYVCFLYKFSKICCFDFVFTQILDHGPSLYMWFCVLGYYRELKMKSIQICPIRSNTPSKLFDNSARRRRVRGLVLDDQKIANTLADERQLISTSTFDTLIQRLWVNGLRCGSSRSLDSLLTKLTVEAKKEEFFRMSEELVDDDNKDSTRDKALKSLQLTGSYFGNIKNNERASEPIRNSEVPKKEIEPIEASICSVIPSETEINTENFEEKSPQIPKPKENNKPTSKLPRRSKTILSYTTSAMVKDAPSSPNSNASSTATSSFTNSVDSKPIIKDNQSNEVISKLKSGIPKSLDMAATKLAHVYKQDGYTVSYLQKAKNAKIRERFAITRDDDDGNVK